jgi:cytochrome c oxidase subunit 2
MVTAVSNTQALFDSLYGLFTVLAFVVGVIFFSVMAYFLMKYRENPRAIDPGDTPRIDRIPPERGHLRSVVILLTLSTLLLAFLVSPSLTQIVTLLTPPEPHGSCAGCEINVIAHQWSWQFVYAQNSNKSATGILRVPVNQIIVLHVTSADVFHDFGIVAFKIKTDAIPGRSNTIWFEPYQVGNFTIRCYELCGQAGSVGHTTMTATLVVMNSTSFQTWYGGP